jgi:Fur family transcriptional regulator, ferric uptake regulator
VTDEHDTDTDTDTDHAQLLARHGLRGHVVVLTCHRIEHEQALHERLRREHPRLGLATVYRALASLADAGVLDRLHHAHGHGHGQGQGSTCFRFCAPGHHHHLTCRGCHAVVELRDCDLDGWASGVAGRHGFTAVEHSVELEGLCAECSTRERD